MKQEQMEALLEATSGIREEYIEEAAQIHRSRPRWVSFAAAAAVLVLVIGLAVAIWPGMSDSTSVPLLVIQAYAADGNTVTLENVGDHVFLEDQTSDLFPGKTVYTLDVSLEGYNGDRAALTDGQFSLYHKGKYLTPGESDAYLSVQWLNRETDGVFGYRITGWCETGDYISVWLYGEDRQVLHQKELRITNEGGYQMQMRISYTHRDDRTTDELIDVVMRQDYSLHVLLSSDLRQQFLLNYTGFRELVQRPDAPAKLLELFVRCQNEKSLFPMDGIIVGMSGDNDWLLGAMLTWDEIWNRLTPEEQALALGHGCSRWMFDETLRFGRYIGTDVIVTADAADSDSTIEVSYNGVTTATADDHIKILPMIGTGEDKKPTYSWRVIVCFEDPTEVTFTVRNKAGDVIEQDVILVTRTENSYEIEVLE